MTQIATVEKILPNGRAEISVPRKSACGHDCEECAGCGVSGSSVRAVASNPIGARVGDKVVVESSSKKLYGMILIVYMLPLLFFLVGYFASAALPSEGLRYAVAIAAFLLGILPAIAYDRKEKRSGGMVFYIVRLF
ncbi:MAG: SoxR reducing system RseC family protein [Oscillospiraceae bacterium]|nr:SoxR reducing system RseC family protein [Oscillospiraceae bacterium]